MVQVVEKTSRGLGDDRKGACFGMEWDEMQQRAGKVGGWWWVGGPAAGGEQTRQKKYGSFCFASGVLYG